MTTASPPDVPTTSRSIEPAQLPAPVRTFLDAHAAGRTDLALPTFAPAAVVTDDGRTFRGTAEVLGFLREAGAEFTYTTELVGAERVDDAHWVAVNRLAGDFPGAVVDLRYRFTLVDDLIAELVIAP